MRIEIVKDKSGFLVKSNPAHRILESLMNRVTIIRQEVTTRETKQSFFTNRVISRLDPCSTNSCLTRILTAKLNGVYKLKISSLKFFTTLILLRTCKWMLLNCALCTLAIITVLSQVVHTHSTLRWQPERSQISFNERAWTCFTAQFLKCSS